jgi:transposase
MMAAHYGVGILPARPYRPRDKAKVEAGVKFAQSYILGRLRHQTFFSLADANRAIALVLERMNGHVMRRLGLSRSDLFASVERPALRALPAPITSSPNGDWHASGLIITSKSRASITRCRTR